MTDNQGDINLRNFLKIRSTLDGNESIFWWTGNVYSHIEGEPSKRLFKFEGYNISRVLPFDGGFYLLTREAAFYRDPTTGKILSLWQNPLNNRTVKVVHVWNDPVNQKFQAASEHGQFAIPTEDLGNGMMCLWFDVMLAYPSPLPRADYPLNSQNDLYQGGELFQFFVDVEDYNREANSVPCSISWTRIANWLPWMEMADHPGSLIYQCRGSKLYGWFEDLPDDIQAIVKFQQPIFANAPTAYSTPNATSWTYFKQQHDAWTP